MQMEYRGYTIESLAEQYGAGWLCSLVVRRHIKSGEEADIRNETLSGPFNSPEEAEREGMQRGRDIADGLPELPDDRLHPPLEKG